ncbi:MAG: hypothetical protein M1837_000811 [Sclerophora amabilis]|nr:MAG: hypothetical protein M1837_000811 [Sclerophora amabilis]
MLTRDIAILHRLHNADRPYATQILQDLPIPQSAVSENMLSDLQPPYIFQGSSPPLPPPQTPNRSQPTACPMAPCPSPLRQSDTTMLLEPVFTVSDPWPERSRNRARVATGSLGTGRHSRGGAFRLSSDESKYGDSISRTKRNRTAESAKRQGISDAPVGFSSEYQTQWSRYDAAISDDRSSTPSPHTSTPPASRQWSFSSPDQTSSAQSAFSDDASEKSDDTRFLSINNRWSRLSDKIGAGEKRRRLKRKLVTAMRVSWVGSKVPRN